MKTSLATLRTALMLLSCLGLTGCWDRKEMDDIAMVMGSGVDLADDGKVDITLQIALPIGIPSSLQGAGKTNKPVMLVSAKGKAVQDQVGKMQQQLSRRIFFGHRAVFIFGEEYARHGIDQILDTLLRFPDSRYNCYVLTTKGTTAKEVLEAPYLLEVIPSIGLKNLQSQVSTYAVSISEFLDALNSRDKSPVMGAVRLIRNGKDVSLAIDGEAVYRENKLVGFVSGPRSVAFKLMHGQGRSVKITTQLEAPGELTSGMVSADILKTSRKVRTSLSRGQLRIEVEFKAKARINANDSTLDLSKPANLKLTEQKLSAELHKMIDGLIEQTQKEFKADALGFGRDVHTQHPYAWKQLRDHWDNTYPDVPVNVRAKLSLERIGRTLKPGQLPK